MALGLACRKQRRCQMRGFMRSSFPTKLETGRSIQILIEDVWVGDDGEPGEDETGYARGAGFCGEKV